MPSPSAPLIIFYAHYFCMPVKKFIDTQLNTLASRIRIIPNSTNCSAGGRVSATIILDLKKPVRARSLSARLYCTEEKKIVVRREMDTYDYRLERELGIQRSTHLQASTRISESVVFAETKEISGEKEYSDSAYSVEFIIPESAPRSQYWVNGRKVTWRIEAKLDIPMSMDVSANAVIEVC